MTSWKFSNGDVVDQKDLADYLDNGDYDGNPLYEMFEDEFNEEHSVAMALYDYAGRNVYHFEYRSWLDSLIAKDPDAVARTVGMSRVSASTRSSKSGKAGTASKSKSVESAKPKTRASKRRC